MTAELVERLRSARRVIALTGAGISAESGVPTFRDAQTGLWAKYRPEDLATPEAFARDPRLVWEWYAWRRERVQNVVPNPGHFALVEMERRIPEFTLVTQNVDDLHRRAGSKRIIELHGNITRVKCFENNHLAAHWGEQGQIPPRCAECGGLLRPDVVWFGENLPAGAFEQALAASETCDMFLSIGTSSLVYPAASLPFAALERGATVVEVNPNATSLTPRAHHSFRAPSGEFLPALVSAVWLR
ncbi:MAG: NAD-dependent deacylase [Verrucomicrobia subdivision 3 bacterium]|nr:NAD-dependent deacylase [Limisphaerales bacterium]